MVFFIYISLVSFVIIIIFYIYFVFLSCFFDFFFFKQKTAYEMRISDWSSDVCSSDLGQLFSGERLGETLGEEFAKHALRIEHEAAGLRLHGWIAQPVYSRASADQQYLYVNGRSIRDRSVAHAVKQA